MTSGEQYNLAPKNMMPISRFKHAFRSIELYPKLQTADNDVLLKLLFVEAFKDHQDFPRDIFRTLSESFARSRISGIALPKFELGAIPLQIANSADLPSRMPFYTYIRSFYQCQKDFAQFTAFLLTPR